MKKTGIRKFSNELDYIIRSHSINPFKTSFLSSILDYLTHYSPGEVELAMENVKKHFYPEFLQLYNNIKDGYNSVINVVNHFYASIGEGIEINERNSSEVIKVNKNLFEKFSDENEKQLLNLIVENLLNKSDINKFVESIVVHLEKLDVYARFISSTMLLFITRYSIYKKAELAEIKYFEYVHSHNCYRSFCKDKNSMHFHINNILRMNNKEINPVIFFGGGLGCHHIWEPDPFYKG